MKQFFRNLGTGVIFFLMSCLVAALGTSAYFGIISVPECTGWEAIGLALASAILALFAGYTIWCMGVIPNSTIDDLKEKISKLEDTEDD